MQLEDHLGDIIRKARTMSNVSAASAARVSGLTGSQLTALEDSGKWAGKINYADLATIIGLDAKKLEGIAAGWRPAPADLNAWGFLRQITTAGEGMTVNCYLVWDEDTREAALFDTGIEAQPVLDCIAENKLTLRHLFITHSHWDHIEALPQFRAAFPSTLIHSAIKGAPKNQRLQPGENFILGSLRISHVATPGHAEDGVTYFIDGWPTKPPRVAIVGDTILAGSMCNGNGQWPLAKEMIRKHILSQPAATLLCPGHGPVTTVAQEKANNPFF